MRKTQKREIQTSLKNNFIITDSNIFYQFLNDQLALGKLSQYILNNTIKNISDIDNILNKIKTTHQNNSPYSKIFKEIEALKNNEKLSLDAIKDLLSKKGINEKQHYALYLNISEKLVSEPMTISRIKQIYHHEMVTPPTEQEFKFLLEKQTQKSNNNSYKEGTVVKKGVETTDTIENTSHHNSEINASKFYQLIYQKMIDRLITVEQYEQLYEKISEQMKAKSFTIEEINQFCTDNKIPTFREDELFRIAKKAENSIDENLKYIKNFKIIETKTDSNEKNLINEDSTVLSIVLMEFINYKRSIGVLNDILKDIKTFIKNNVNKSNIDEFIENIQQIKKIDPEYQEGLTKIENIFTEIKNKLDEFKKSSFSQLNKKDQESIFSNFDFKQTQDKFLNFNSIGISKTDRIKLLTYILLNNHINTNFSINAIKEIFNDNKISEPTGKEFEILANSAFWGSKNVFFQNTIEMNVNNDLTLSIKVFSDEEKMSGLTQKEIEEALKNALITFNEAFGLMKNNSLDGINKNKAIFTLHFFAKRESFLSYLNKNKESTVLGSSLYNHIYIWLDSDKDSLNDTIKHEFVHALVNYNNLSGVLPKVFSEGIAEYIPELSKGKNAIDFASQLKRHLNKADYKNNLTLKNLLSDQFLEDNNLDPYTVGPAVIAYFEDKFPSVIDKSLYDTSQSEKNKEGRQKEFFEIIKKFSEEEPYSTHFKDWVETHSRDMLPNLPIKKTISFEMDGKSFSIEVFSETELLYTNIQAELKKTFGIFNQKFNFIKDDNGAQPLIFRLFLFQKNNDDYSRFLKSKDTNPLSEYYSETSLESNVISNMYVNFDKPDDKLITDAFNDTLSLYITSDIDSKSIFTASLNYYIKMFNKLNINIHKYHSMISQLYKNLNSEYSSLNLTKIIKDDFFNNPTDTKIMQEFHSNQSKSFESLAVIAYLQEKHPNFIKTLLTAKSAPENSDSLTKGVIDSLLASESEKEKVNQGFQAWLEPAAEPQLKENHDGEGSSDKVHSSPVASSSEDSSLPEVSARFQQDEVHQNKSGLLLTQEMNQFNTDNDVTHITENYILPSLVISTLLGVIGA
ncbi:hypothetical protein [Candidatus Hamiltonella endosymbiont of Tuberolachnus salignus]|uniref:hypothetical protein n=1 Tax=Candidatus Williamhamiltonella endosymbiont of Tuberolachnus salignus TaxID=3077954 RepID=UPI0030CD2B61